MNTQIIKVADAMGNFAVNAFHRLALFGIGSATVYAAGITFLNLFNQQAATIGDILTLFIYLELGAMVGIYFRTNHMPVRFLLYIAITALTRHMIDIMSHRPVNIEEMLAVSAATLIVCVCVLLVRFTSHNFPSDKKDDVV
jgi:protein PsiE